MSLTPKPENVGRLRQGRTPLWPVLTAIAGYGYEARSSDEDDCIRMGGQNCRIADGQQGRAVYDYPIVFFSEFTEEISEAFCCQ